MRFKSMLIACALPLILSACTTAQPSTPTTPATPPSTAQQPAPETPANPELILATTTSTQDSGLLDVIKPQFEKETKYHLKIVAVGTGQALAMGERGEADALLVHAPASEQKLVDSGVAVNYHQVMHNDFIIVGPAADPAGIKSTKSALTAFRQIAAKQAPFVSRGDDSGTNKMELDLWAKAAVKPAGAWYIQSGTGMGNTLSIASEKNAYTLTDRATYLSLKQNLALAIVLEGDAPLLNIYHVAQVSPTKFSKVNGPGGEAFVKFMMNPDTQKLIGSFGTEKYGQALFFPDAAKGN
jgi:tungstate transport system substrate-binding protein